MIVLKIWSRCFASSESGSVVGLSWEKLVGAKEGKAAPMVLVHGILASRQCLKSLAKLVTEQSGLSTYVVDLRNHGDSPWTATMTYDDTVADLLGFFHTRGIERAHLLGHSLGGRVVMSFAQKHPELVDRLIIGDVSPLGVMSVVERVQDICKAMLNVENACPESSLSEARSIVATQLKHLDHLNRNFLLKNYVLKADRKYGWRCNVETIREAFTECNLGGPVAIRRKFTTPTIIIRGTIHPWIEERDIPEIKELFDSKLEVVSLLDTTHCNYSQKPREFVNIICYYIETTE